MRHRTIGLLVTLALGLLVAPLAADVQPLKGAPGIERGPIHTDTACSFGRSSPRNAASNTPAT
jgi:hypothetical protein